MIFSWVEDWLWSKMRRQLLMMDELALLTADTQLHSISSTFTCFLFSFVVESRIDMTHVKNREQIREKWHEMYRCYKGECRNSNTLSASNSSPLVHPRVFCDSVGRTNTLSCPFTLFCPYILPINQYFLPRFDADPYLQISIRHFPLFLFWYLQTSLMEDAWFLKPRFEMLQPRSTRIDM